jgi:hypothetical protein
MEAVPELPEADEFYSRDAGIFSPAKRPNCCLICRHSGRSLAFGLGFLIRQPLERK